MEQANDPVPPSTRTPLSLASKVVQANGVMAAPGEGEIMLIREDRGDCFILRGSGIQIWQAARQDVSLDAIHAALMDMYDVDADICRADILSGVEELLSAGLLVLTS